MTMNYRPDDWINSNPSLRIFGIFCQKSALLIDLLKIATENPQTVTKLQKNCFSNLLAIIPTWDFPWFPLLIFD